MSEETPAPEAPDSSTEGLSQDAKRHEENKEHHPVATEATAASTVESVTTAPNAAVVEKVEKPKAKKSKDKNWLLIKHSVNTNHTLFIWWWQSFHVDPNLHGTPLQSYWV